MCANGPVGFEPGCMAGWLVDWLAGWVVGWVGGWVAGWLVGWLAGQLANPRNLGFRDQEFLILMEILIFGARKLKF